ncbi:MAG: S8 family serine peptidase, partial [Chthoniobacteraceae bacterium]
VTGQGVLVAILDRGIDWKNDDFRNDDGTTRIKWIFDLSDDTGASAPGNTYGVGTIYTEAQINAALTGGATLATRDAVGHGSTTAGIMCGNGRGLPSRKYRGVAPNASIIVVKITGGAPAHDSEPAEPSFYDGDRVLIGFDFVRDKAAALGLPCVMLPNVGSPGGPTDGTSEWCRKVDAMVKPGLLFVNGTGDDGGAANRATGTVAANGDASIQIQRADTGFLRLDLWYEGADRFDITITTPSGTFGPYLAPANDNLDIQSPTGMSYFHLGSDFDDIFFGADNGKREIFSQLTGPVGTYTIKLHGATIAAGGKFEASLNSATIYNSSRFLTYAYPGNRGNIWDGATAFKNICPGDYVVRTDYVDIDAIPRSLTSEGTVGQIWKGSSAGPTFDGRLGIDLASPGDSLFTTYNPTSYWATFRFNLIQDGLGKYGRASAVSAAAPFTTGVVALMLQMKPTLDAATAKQILQATARADAFTGAVPNTQWGYGKIDVLAALSRLADTLLRITAVQRISADISVSYTSVVGKNYRVEYKDDLASAGAWTPVPGYSNVGGSGTVQQAIDIGGGLLPKRFYRVVSLP